MPNQPIYLDNAATTPLEPAVFEVMKRYFLYDFGNAGSRTHGYGAAAAAAVEEARREVGLVVDASPEEVIFTSGATESNNIAIQGLREDLRNRREIHIITTAIEHKAVLEPVEALLDFPVTVLPVDSSGRVDPSDVADALKDSTGLVSIMHVNNETGIVQPIDDIAAVLENHWAWFHVDAAQGFGKDLPSLRNKRIDMISLSGHKIYGPKGVGALITRQRPDRTRPPLNPIAVGGGQERGLRAGTLPVPLIAGLGEAARLCRTNNDARNAATQQRASEILKFIDDNGGTVNGDRTNSISNNINASVEGLDSEAFIVSTKDLIAVSNGAACSSASYRLSHVLRAMNLPQERQTSAIRFSPSHLTDPLDLSEVGERVAATRF